ncbi:hypothetical protein HDK90DRAFT_470538 [Phyllosticta capitalensis]|uniref:Uncharacterized protein n=2 Tax=Phyllosticta capitalensis TaxID=121624 RepID=A0ABR1YAV7_9PEZI
MSNTKRRFDDFASDQDPISNAQATPAQQPAPKKPCHVPIAHKPRVLYANHPESGVGKNFHNVPYPLGLMPYNSWSLLRNPPGSDPSQHFSCPSCRKSRPSPSAHRRKMFLVAERLSREKGKMPTALLERNQEMTWEVNFQLGIHEPFVEELDQVPGGKYSQENPMYPFEDVEDFFSAMLLITKGEDLTEASYNLWQSMLDILYHDPGLDEIQETHEDDAISEKDTMPAPRSHSKPQSSYQSPYPPLSPGQPQEGDANDLPTPPSSSHPTEDFPPLSKKPLEETSETPLPTPPGSSQPISNPPSSAATAPSTPARQQLSQDAASHPDMSKAPTRPPRRSLPEFYSLLDAVERTSHIGAQFLEAYATGLRNDACTDCWFKLHVC